VLGDKDAAFANELWNASANGNFEHSNILHTTGSLAEEANEFDMEINEFIAKVDAISNKLLVARQAREKPIRDEKIISAWNGMMISAFADASDEFGRQDYLDAAVRAGEFIWDNNRSEAGLLLRTFFAGSASVDSAQEDYAYLSEGYLYLYDMTNDKKWLTRAEALVNTMHERFWDAEQGGYFMGMVKVGAVRPKDLYDSSIPTGNAVALRSYARLWHRTGKDVYKHRAEALLIAFSGQLQVYPSAFAYMMTGTNELLNGEVGHRQYAARGNVSVRAVKNADNIRVELNMAPGWHVNANKPNQDYLIPTALLDVDGKAYSGVTYPEPLEKVLGFSSGAELKLYEETTTIDVPLANLAIDSSKPILPFTVQLQACDDTVCLPPEDVAVSVLIDK